ncbi:MAG: hypothetical protein H0U73_02615 [Tatlockia sp.]|nr:hypothetical protein [Tatlockia sp.]
MSLTKFEVRRLAMNPENKSILKLWSQILDDIFQQNNDFNFEQAFIDDQPGLGNRVLSYTCDLIRITIFDSGKKLKLEELKVTLDQDAVNFLDKFQKELVKLEIAQKLPNKLDSDKYEEDTYAIHYFAILKEILLRTMAQALQSNGSLDNEADKYLTVFNNFQSKLPTLTLAKPTISEYPVEYIKGNNYNPLLTSLSMILPKWSEDLAEMILAIKELNKAKNTIASNITTLKLVRNHVQRQLYCRLLLIDSNRNADRADLEPVRAAVLLSQLEDKLLDSSLSNNNTLTLDIISGPTNLLLNQIKKAETIGSIIDIKKEQTHTPYIKKLYLALNQIEGLLSFVQNISTLTTDVGSLLFILKTIATASLSTKINACISFARNDCVSDFDGPGLSIFELETLTAVKIAQNSEHDFSKLDNQHSHQTLLRVKGGLECLQKIAELIESPELVDLTTVYKLHSSMFPNLENKPTKQIEGKKPPTEPDVDDPDQRSVKSTKIHSNQKNQHQPQIKNLLLGTNCLFQSLGLDRQIVLEQLLEKIKIDSSLQKKVSQEALNRFKEEYLPIELIQLLNDEERVQANDSLTSLKTMQSALATSLRKEPLLKSAEYNRLSDLDLIRHVSHKEPNILDKPAFASLCSTYFPIANKRDTHLNAIVAKEEFIIAYFTHYYLTKKENFAYAPNKSGLLSELLKMINKPIQIWELDEQNCHVKGESFNFNQDNSLLTTHLMHYPKNDIGVSLFEKINPPKQIIKENKYLLKDILAQMMGDDSLNIESKKEILSYFCVNKTTSADSMLSIKLEHIQEAERQLELINQKMELHEAFYNECFKYALNHLKNFLSNSPKSLSKPSIKRQIKDAIENYFRDEAVKTYTHRAEKLHFGVILQWDKNSYWIDYSEPEAKFKLYLKNKNLYYGQDFDGKSLVFNENSSEENKDRDLKILKVSKNDFIKTLNTAIKKEEHRETLSEEIYSYLERMHQGSVPLNQTFISDEIAGKFNWKDKLSTHINNKNTAKDVEYEIRDYCASLTTCQTYIALYEKDKTFWVGRYSAKLYAQESQINLYIFDKQAGNKLPVLMLDKRASHQANNALDTIYIAFEDKQYFNEIIRIQTKSPEVLWEQYTKTFVSIINNKIQSEFKENIENIVFLKYIENCIQGLNILSLPNVGNQRKIDELVTLIQQKQDLLILKNKRDEIKINFSGDTNNYLYKKTRDQVHKIEDFTLSVDEPLNTEKHTLLHLAVKKSDFALVSHLLYLGASVATKNRPSCKILIKPHVDIKTSNSYIVRKINEKNWQVYYRDDEQKATTISIKTIPGLSNLLATHKDSEPNNKDIHQVISKYHLITHQSTPLMLAARQIGFVKKENSNLFFSLLVSGLKEAKPKDEDLKAYVILKRLSRELLTPKFIEHFEKYINIQRERVKDDSWFRPVKILHYFFGTDRTSDRGPELAILIQDLIEGELGHNYKELLHNTHKVRKNALTQLKSELFSGLMKIVEVAEQFIREREVYYDNEYQEYTKSQNKKWMAVDEHEQLILLSEELEKIKKSDIDKDLRIQDLETKTANIADLTVQNTKYSEELGLLKLQMEELRKTLTLITSSQNNLPSQTLRPQNNTAERFSEKQNSSIGFFEKGRSILTTTSSSTNCLNIQDDSNIELQKL